MTGKKQGLFVTGTDTDVGKTYVSRYLADAFSRFTRVTYFKPVQTGCAPDEEGRLVAPDFEYVMKGKAVQTSSYEDHVPYRFEPACSPHLAANMAGTHISIDFVLDRLESVKRGQDLVLVEGAGGVLAPLDETTLMLDLMKAVNFPVVLVTAPKLGTLNHTFLSLDVLKNAGITVAVVAFNNASGLEEDYIYRDNLKMIRKRTGPIPILEIKHGASPDPKTEEIFHDIARKHF